MLCQNWHQALDLLQNLLIKLGDQKDLLEDCYEIYNKINDLELMLNITERLLAIDSENIEYSSRLAELLSRSNRGKEAAQAYDILVKNHYKNLDNTILEAWFVHNQKYNPGALDTMLAWLKKLLSTDPEDINALWLYGKTYSAIGEHEKALGILVRAHKLVKEDIKIMLILSSIYAIMGNIKLSKQFAKMVLDRDPVNISALTLQGRVHTYSCGDPIFKQLNFAASKLAEMNESKQCSIHYLLGKAYDDAGNLRTAMEHYKIGGILHSRGRNLSELATLQNIKHALIKHFNMKGISNEIKSISKNNKPIFIVGMPRSGTTLMEQVLAGIDGIYGAGELKFLPQLLQGIPISEVNQDILRVLAKKYISEIERISPNDSKRVIDKLPHNFQFVGFIHQMFPNAFIIHARRHPIETCLSAYRIRFSMGLHYSDDLATLGRYYRVYDELMKYWQSILPKNSMLEVRYEDMVTNLKDESQRLAKYLDLPWSDSCLDFHKRQNKVTTASVLQVRKPIYTSSMNRWRKYAPYLEPLLDEIGDLVEVYERELLANRR